MNPATSHPSLERTAREKLRDLLHAAGLRSTPSRIAVLSLLHDTQGPLSHADVFNALQDQGFDRATLYRNLTDLAEANLLTRADRGDHIWRFELRRAAEHSEADHPEAAHPHFVCTDCGTISCLPEMSLPTQNQNVPSKTLIARVSEIVVKGQCQECV